jgi:D-proline reductase (dithiol) PrdB
VALPVDRLHALARAGMIGSVADTHYSIMGYQGSDTTALVEKSAPEIAASLGKEEVDLVVLAPV